MTGDRVIRFAATAVVCAVAAFAAVVSYSHIYDLGRARGQDGTAARLLPLSVDGLILAASLVLLHEARNGRDAPGLARLMLWLGIGATIGANLAYGAGYGLLGALISAWPAVVFIGAVELVMQLVRRSRGPRAATSVPAVPEVPGDVEQAALPRRRAAVSSQPWHLPRRVIRWTGSTVVCRHEHPPVREPRPGGLHCALTSRIGRSAGVTVTGMHVQPRYGS